MDDGLAKTVILGVLSAATAAGILFWGFRDREQPKGPPWPPTEGSNRDRINERTPGRRDARGNARPSRAGTPRTGTSRSPESGTKRK